MWASPQNYNPQKQGDRKEDTWANTTDRLQPKRTSINATLMSDKQKLADSYTYKHTSTGHLPAQTGSCLRYSRRKWYFDTLSQSALHYRLYNNLKPTLNFFACKQVIKSDILFTPTCRAQSDTGTHQCSDWNCISSLTSQYKELLIEPELKGVQLLWDIGGTLTHLLERPLQQCINQVSSKPGLKLLHIYSQSLWQDSHEECRLVLSCFQCGVLWRLDRVQVSLTEQQRNTKLVANVHFCE